MVPRCEELRATGRGGKGGVLDYKMGEVWQHTGVGMKT